MFKFLAGLFVLLASTALFAAGNDPGDCGLPDSFESRGVSLKKKRDLRKASDLTRLSPFESQAAVALGRKYESQETGRPSTLGLEEAAAFLVDSFSGEAYIYEIVFKKKTLTVIWGWPGDNQVGYVLAKDTADVIGEISDGDFLCVDPYVLSSGLLN